MTSEAELIERINSVLLEEIQPTQILLFGSRAKGNAQVYSDFDIAVNAPQPSHDQLLRIKEKLDAELGLFSFNLVFLPDLDHEFRQIVLQSTRIIYEARN